MESKYRYEALGDCWFAVVHIESGKHIAVTESAEKAHFLACAANLMHGFGAYDLADFLKAVKEERTAFSEAVRTGSWWMGMGAEGRVPVEGLLIMYDKMQGRIESAMDTTKNKESVQAATEEGHG